MLGVSRRLIGLVQVSSIREPVQAIGGVQKNIHISSLGIPRRHILGIYPRRKDRNVRNTSGAGFPGNGSRRGVVGGNSDGVRSGLASHVVDLHSIGGTRQGSGG
jgi:hypothetical protein